MNAVGDHPSVSYFLPFPHDCCCQESTSPVLFFVDIFLVPPGIVSS